MSFRPEASFPASPESLALSSAAGTAKLFSTRGPASAVAAPIRLHPGVGILATVRTDLLLGMEVAPDLSNLKGGKVACVWLINSVAVAKNTVGSCA